MHEIKLTKDEANWFGWAMLEGNIISHEHGFRFENSTIKLSRQISKRMYNTMRYQLVDKRLRRGRAPKEAASDLWIKLVDAKRSIEEGSLTASVD